MCPQVQLNAIVCSDLFIASESVHAAKPALVATVNQLSNFDPALLVGDADAETHLIKFIAWVMTESRSKVYSLEESLQLLDYGWQAQKLLWQLRKTRST
jgi:hypothetical protein